MLDFLVKKVNVSSFNLVECLFLTARNFLLGSGSQAHVCPARAHVTSGVCLPIKLLYLTF